MSETFAANCFHIVMQPWSLYILLNPICQDGYREPFAPLKDDLCFNTVDKRAVYMILWLGAYMTSDGFTAMFVVKGNTQLDKLMNLHHFISASSCLGCLGVGYGYVYIGLLTTLMEYSTLPVNYRALFTYEEVVGTLGNVTNITFFVLYTIFRIILLPYVTYKIWITIGYIDPYIGPV